MLNVEEALRLILERAATTDDDGDSNVAQP